MEVADILENEAEILVRVPTTYAIFEQDGPDHLGL